MTGPTTILAVAAGGALGSLLRYAMTASAGKAFGIGFPYGTLSVNVAGSFLMGALVALLAMKDPVGQTLKLFLTTGFLGGFTTFSAFSLETIMLWERKNTLGLAYALASVTLSLLACWAGLRLIRSLTP